MRYKTERGKVIAENDKAYAFFHLTPYKRRVARIFLPTSTAPGKMRDRVKLAGIRGARALLTGPADGLPGARALPVRLAVRCLRGRASKPPSIGRRALLRPQRKARRCLCCRASAGSPAKPRTSSCPPRWVGMSRSAPMAPDGANRNVIVEEHDRRDAGCAILFYAATYKDLERLVGAFRGALADVLRADAVYEAKERPRTRTRERQPGLLDRMPLMVRLICADTWAATTPQDSVGTIRERDPRASPGDLSLTSTAPQALSRASPTVSTSSGHAALARSIRRSQRTSLATWPRPAMAPPFRRLPRSSPRRLPTSRETGLPVFLTRSATSTPSVLGDITKTPADGEPSSRSMAGSASQALTRTATCSGGRSSLASRCRFRPAWRWRTPSTTRRSSSRSQRLRRRALLRPLEWAGGLTALATIDAFGTGASNAGTTLAATLFDKGSLGFTPLDNGYSVVLSYSGTNTPIRFVCRHEWQGIDDRSGDGRRRRAHQHGAGGARRIAPIIVGKISARILGDG